MTEGVNIAILLRLSRGTPVWKKLTLIYGASVCLTDGSSVVHAWWGYTTLIYIMSYAGVILSKYLYLNLLLHQNHNTILVMMLAKNNTIYWGLNSYIWHDMYLRHTIVKLMDMLLLGSADILQKYHFTMQSYICNAWEMQFIAALTPTYMTQHTSKTYHSTWTCCYYTCTSSIISLGTMLEKYEAPTKA